MPTGTADRSTTSATTRAPEAGRPLRFSGLVLYTGWFALVAGLLETLILATQRYALDRVIYRSDHYLWMPAAGAALLFSLVMALFWGLGLLWPRLRREPSIVGVLFALSVFSVLMVPRWFHPAAALVLSMGLAVVGSRKLITDRFVRVAQRSITVLLAAVLVLAGLSFGYPRLRERTAIHGLAAARAGAPNIIFLILDTVRAKSLSLYGYTRETTPNLRALAQRGVVFERAIAPSPWTLPTHASFFTGRLPQELSADRFTPLNDAHATLAEQLAGHGYASAGFVANLAYATREFGLARGFHHWNDYGVGLGQVVTNSSLGRFILLDGYSGGRNSWLMRVLGVDHWIGHTRSVADVNAKLVQWLDGRTGKQPLFLFANYFDAHLPYLPPDDYLGRYGPIATRTFGTRLREERPGKWLERGDAFQERALLDRYEESITYLDAALGDLMRELEQRGLLANTILVIGSDHGEEFGEHGFYEHDTSVYFTQVHVPLLVIAPGRAPQGARVAQPVGLADLASTLLELSTGNGDELPGHSLSATWTGRAAAANAPVLATLDLGRQSQASLVTPQYHFIRFKTGQERLYDHRADPHEQNDLSGSPAAGPVLDALRAELRRRAGERIFQPPRAAK